MLPSLFVAHGAPTLALEQNDYTEFLQKLGASFPKPKAIVLFSAHWEEERTTVGASEAYEMIYDFHGFPESMYKIRYPAKGDPDLAARIVGMLEAAGIPASLDAKRGLDHGSWVPLRLLYPEADVPVVAMSVNPGHSGADQYRIGQALAPLRAEDVLIVGSGGTVHNLRRIAWEADSPEPWAVQFDDWLEERIANWNTDELLAYDHLAPHAREAVPRSEHFVPLLLAMGAADDARQGRRLYGTYSFGTLSLSCWQFG